MLKRETDLANLVLLTEMNIALRLAEKIDNSMTDSAVEARMKAFILGDEYQIYTIWHNHQIVGYAAIKADEDPLYLRQLYIKTEFRRLGIGGQALSEIRKIFPEQQIDVEVMAWNPEASRFYEKHEFKLRTLKFRLG